MYSVEIPVQYNEITNLMFVKSPQFFNLQTRIRIFKTLITR